MKKTIFMALLFSIILTSCKEDDRLIYNDKARIELVSEIKRHQLTMHSHLFGEVKHVYVILYLYL